MKLLIILTLPAILFANFLGLTKSESKDLLEDTGVSHRYHEGAIFFRENGQGGSIRFANDTCHYVEIYVEDDYVNEYIERMGGDTTKRAQRYPHGTMIVQPDTSAYSIIVLTDVL